MKLPILNTTKPGALWRFMLQLRGAALLVMGSVHARSHIQYRCRTMRQDYYEQHMASLPAHEQAALDDAFLGRLSQRQGW